MDKRYEEHEVDTIATSLYEGGWRAEDKDWMMEEYGFTEEQIKQICKKLQEIAK